MIKKLVIAAFILLAVTVSCYRADSALAVPLDPGGDLKPKVALQCKRHPFSTGFKICTGRILFEGHGSPYEIYWKEGSRPWSSKSGTAITYQSTRRCYSPLTQNPIQFRVEDRIGILSNIASASCEVSTTGSNPVIP